MHIIVYCVDNGGLPPLLRAAQEGLTVAVRVLLGAPVINVNATATRSKKTALVLAARAGHLEAVELLLGAGADVSLGDRRDWTAMHFAAWKGHLGERGFLAAVSSSNLQGRLIDYLCHVSTALPGLNDALNCLNQVYHSEHFRHGC